MTKKKPPIPRSHEVDRIIVGNQIAIMRMLAHLMRDSNFYVMANARTHDIKGWWRHKYGEEVGYDSHYDKELS